MNTIKFDFVLSREQQILAESNLLLIDKVISRYIHTNEGVCGLGRDDLYQEGAAALCKASATYDGSSAQFGSCATTVIRNHLLNHCKTVNAGQRSLPAVSLDDRGSDDGRPPPCPEPSAPDGVDDLIERLDAADLLADCKRRYTGVARLGVEALELKVKGLSRVDIARLYHTAPNNVNAWISRATQKIRTELTAQSEKV